MAIEVARVRVCVWQVVAEEFTAEVAAAGQTDEPDIPLFAYAVEHDEVRPYVTHDAHCAQWWGAGMRGFGGGGGWDHASHS